MNANKRLAEVLLKAHQGGFKTSSNFARSYAKEVAVAASCGMITTRIKGKTFGTTWFITKLGLENLNECYCYD